MNKPNNENEITVNYKNKLAESFVTSDKIFYFAKINIHGNIFKPNLDELIHTEIPRVIEAAQDIKLKNSTISFTASFLGAAFFFAGAFFAVAFSSFTVVLQAKLFHRQ